MKKNRLLSIIVLISIIVMLSFAALETPAYAVTWTLTNVAFEDGGSATGTIDVDSKATSEQGYKINSADITVYEPMDPAGSVGEAAGKTIYKKLKLKLKDVKEIGPIWIQARHGDYSMDYGLIVGEEVNGVKYYLVLSLPIQAMEINSPALLEAGRAMPTAATAKGSLGSVFFWTKASSIAIDHYTPVMKGQLTPPK